MKWYLRACFVCGGDLYEEDTRLLACLMCGRSFSREDVRARWPELRPPAEGPMPIDLLGSADEVPWAGGGRVGNRRAGKRACTKPSMAPAKPRAA